MEALLLPQTDLFKCLVSLQGNQHFYTFTQIQNNTIRVSCLLSCCWGRVTFAQSPCYSSLVASFRVTAMSRKGCRNAMWQQVCGAAPAELQRR